MVRLRMPACDWNKHFVLVLVFSFLTLMLFMMTLIYYPYDIIPYIFVDENIIFCI